MITQKEARPYKFHNLVAINFDKQTIYLTREQAESFAFNILDIIKEESNYGK